jgi:hypothetical protein
LALWLLCSRGHGALAAFLTLPACWLLSACRNRDAGTLLRCQAGDWSIVREGVAQPVAPLPGAVRLPWLIHLRWREPGRSRTFGMWLLADSADAASLAALRRCLVVYCG